MGQFNADENIYWTEVFVLVIDKIYEKEKCQRETSEAGQETSKFIRFFDKVFYSVCFQLKVINLIIKALFNFATDCVKTVQCVIKL